MRPQSPSRPRDVLRRRRCAVLLLTARPGGGGPASPARWRQTSACGGVAGPGAEGTGPLPPPLVSAALQEAALTWQQQPGPDR